MKKEGRRCHKKGDRKYETDDRKAGARVIYKCPVTGFEACGARPQVAPCEEM